MHIERIHSMLEKLTECALSQMERGIECVDTCEMGQVVDMIKDLCEAEYHAKVTKAMEKYANEEILEKWEAYSGDGRRHYDNYRYKSGRFAPKGSGRRGYIDYPVYDDYDGYDPMSTYYRERDIDRESKGKMYYTEPQNESKLEVARRHYTEGREAHKANTPEDKQEKLNMLDGYLTELKEDTKMLITDMTPEERTMTKQKMQGILNLL